MYIGYGIVCSVIILTNGMLSFQGKCWFHQNRTRSQAHQIDKKLLEILRKETGYPVTKCHLALKNSNNDVAVAKEWLAEKAKKEGWTKAQEKSNRSTNQGLVGVVKQENFAALVEVLKYFYIFFILYIIYYFLIVKYITILYYCVPFRILFLVFLECFLLAFSAVFPFTYYRTLLQSNKDH